MKNKRVLITGGAGYLGSVMTGRFLQGGNKVTCIDNLMYGQQSPLFFADNPDFNFVYGDVRDKSRIEKLVSKSDVILPLAAIVGMPACKLRPLDVVSTNFDAVKAINDLRSKEQILVFPTTNSGYGTTTGEVYCTEETPLTPISEYGITKSNAEAELLNSGKPVITLRLATVFGLSPRTRTDLLVNDFVWQAMTAGSIVLYEKHFKRNFVHVKDVASAFEHCVDKFDSMNNQADKNKTKGVYNFGLDSANMSKAELAAKVKEHLPRFEIFEGAGEDPDKRNYIVSSDKIMKTGLKPEYSLDIGILELIRGYEIMLKKNPYKNV